MSDAPAARTPQPPTAPRKGQGSGASWLRSLLSVPGAVQDVLDGPDRLPPSSLDDRQARLGRPERAEAWLALQPGLRMLDHPDGWAALTVQGGTAFAIGGVHRPDREAAYQAIRQAAAGAGLRRQAVYPVRAEDRDAALAAGFGLLPVGVEAWVDLDGFTLKGKAFADLRQMRNRATRRGVGAQEVDRERWADRLAACWRAFLAGRTDPWDVRWLSGRPRLREDRGRRFFAAHVDGVVQAFCTVLPGPDGLWVLDVMCRRPDALAGSMELLLVHTMQALGDDGATSVSLGPCPGAGEGVQALGGLVGHGFRWAWDSRLADRWFGFRSLAFFKDKFRPRYEPVELGLAPRAGLWALYLAGRIWALGAG